ncbi:MAG: hypothetical protein ACJAZN_000078 [Planctomycetota bacterium]|jgi:hypothetical protein
MIYGTPNWLAFAALLAVVPIAIGLYQRLKPAAATAIVGLGAVLMLPESVAFDLPVMPPLGKDSIPGLAMVIGSYITAPSKLRDARPLGGIDLLFVLFCLGSVGTILTNSDALVFGPRFLPALSVYDGVAEITKNTLVLYLPFLVARALIRSSADLRVLMRIVVVFALGQSVLSLAELRLSPQLHNWVYGFHPTLFETTVRLGGYRPNGFTKTGLELSMFMLAATIAALLLWRIRSVSGAVPVYLLVILILSKSLGTIVYSVVAVPVIAAGHRFGIIAAALIAVTALGFPFLKAGGVLPEEAAMSIATDFDAERARSLNARIEQDHQLLDRAIERPVFGWGGYGRNRILHPVTGKDMVVTDGAWTLFLGTRGAVGFAALFGMILLPVLILFWRFNQVQSRDDQLLLGGLALITSFYALDLFPNGLFNYLPLFFAGALHGATEGIINDGLRSTILPAQLQEIAGEDSPSSAKGRPWPSSTRYGRSPGELQSSPAPTPLATAIDHPEIPHS